MPYTVLVTVGSTRFDALVHAALSDAFVDAVRDVGGADARVIVQYGQSAVPPSAWPTEPRSIEGIVWERAVVGGVEVLRGAYVPELRPWLAQADVVVTHAGAGTLLEALRAPQRPRILAVPNGALMDDHQRELADVLGADGYVVVGTPSALPAQVRAVSHAALAAFPPRAAHALDALLRTRP
ncbi:ALG13 [Malassezia furfur]|nr:ALG13 [Malassezia furfur]